MACRAFYKKSLIELWLLEYQALFPVVVSQVLTQEIADIIWAFALPHGLYKLGKLEARGCKFNTRRVADLFHNFSFVTSGSTATNSRFRLRLGPAASHSSGLVLSI
jgi:hypothetical protein